MIPGLSCRTSRYKRQKTCIRALQNEPVLQHARLWLFVPPVRQGGREDQGLELAVEGAGVNAQFTGGALAVAVIAFERGLDQVLLCRT